jgi:hypothetical protein
MPQCQFPVFCYFCVSEKLHRKYSRNWTKQKPKSLITWHKDGVQRREGDGPEAGRTYWWRGPGPGHATRGCDRLVHPLTSPFCHIYSPRREIPRGPNSFPENILQAAAAVDARLGGSRSSSRYPAGEWNHHRRPSSSPCMPPEWCVSGLPWTMGP